MLTLKIILSKRNNSCIESIEENDADNLVSVNCKGSRKQVQILFNAPFKLKQLTYAKIGGVCVTDF